MLHLIQKLDRGRWKTVAIATDSDAAQDRFERAVGATPTARFRLVAMIHGAEKLIRQVEPRLKDLLPADLLPVPAPDDPPSPAAPPVLLPVAPLVAIDPFIPPPAQIPTQLLGAEAGQSRSFNPLRLALQFGGAVILVLVLVDNVAAVSDRMRAGAEPPSSPPAQIVTPALPEPVLAAPIETPIDDHAGDRPAAMTVMGPEPGLLPGSGGQPEPEAESGPDPEPPVGAVNLLADGIKPPIMAVVDQVPDLSIPDCRALAQAQARFASRIDVAGAVQAGFDQVEGADLSFRTVSGDWRPIRYRCRPALGGGVRLVDVQLVPIEK